MRTEKIIRVICIVCIICLMAPAASFASEEPEVAAVPEAAAVSETALEAIPFEPAGEPAETAGEDTGPSEAKAAVLPEEPPLPEEEDGDPMALRMAMQLDGGTKTFSDFTTRALNNETLRKGIDVSSWQAGINWQKVKEAGVEFAIIRAAYRTYGSGALYKDGYFDANMRGAKAAGIKVGVYIFSQAITQAEAIEEADYLLSLVKGYDIDLPLVFDFEYVTGGRLKTNLGKRHNSDMCLAFCNRVEAAGYDSMVYANASTLNGNLYPSEFSRIWLAHYTSKTSYSGKYEYWQCSGSGTVSGVSGDVDLDFWFEPKRPELPFTDVRTEHWFYASVLKAYKNKIVSGMSETTFAPGSTATRGQFTAMIHRMKGTPGYTKAAAFTDLIQPYYRDAVNWAAENGIVSGYSAESFMPEKAITREELVTILYRMEGEPETDGLLDGFTDAHQIHSWAADAMAWAVEKKIVSGYEDSTLRPRNNATRAEVCAILVGYAGL